MNSLRFVRLKAFAHSVEHLLWRFVFRSLDAAATICPLKIESSIVLVRPNITPFNLINYLALFQARLVVLSTGGTRWLFRQRFISSFGQGRRFCGSPASRRRLPKQPEWFRCHRQ